MCYMNYTMGSVGMCNLEFHHHLIILSSLIFIIERSVKIVTYHVLKSGKLLADLRIFVIHY
jgi:hypothetical protein